MYRVIEMYGDFEPWWFMEGWEEDIIASRRFDNYYAALKFYKSCWFDLEERIPLYKSRGDLMTISGIQAIKDGVRNVMNFFNNTIR